MTQDKTVKQTSTAVADQEDLLKMPVLAHFAELRTRFIRMIIAIFLCFFICFGYAPEIYAYLSKPLLSALPSAAKSLIFITPVEPFYIYIKLSLISSVFITAPYLFFQIWRFIAPGLYKNERKNIIPLVASSSFVFLLGAAFCYFIVLPLGLKTLIAAGMTDAFMASAQITMEAYFNFTTRLLLAFGIVFEMPVFSYFLTRLGILKYQQLLKQWRVAVVAIFIIAAILTPPDVITQITLAIPMCLLYALSVGLSYWFRHKEDNDEAITAAK